MIDAALVKDGGVPRLSLPIGARDHAQGSWGAAVSLLEYGDFECAHCAESFPVVKETRRWLRGELLYVFRHFPAAQHPPALRAAEAAEAAGAQGRFWGMHELLCEGPSALGDADLNRFALKLHLDLGRFEREMLEHFHLPKVREDVVSGLASGVTQTPTFFINGVRHTGASDLDSLLAAIEEAGNRVADVDR